MPARRSPSAIAARESPALSLPQQTRTILPGLAAGSGSADDRRRMVPYSNPCTSGAGGKAFADLIGGLAEGVGIEPVTSPALPPADGAAAVFLGGAPCGAWLLAFDAVDRFGACAWRPRADLPSPHDRAMAGPAV